MKTKLIALGLTVFGFLNLARSQTLVTVTAKPLWTDTGISLTSNEWVNVNTFGLWSFVGGEINDPDGVPWPTSDDAWLNIGTHGSLIAFIGSDPYQGSEWEGGVFQTNQYMEVGTASQFESNTNGELWLGINDDAFIGTPDDNSGSFLAAISLGFSTCDNYSNMTLSVAQVTSNSFSFYISNGIPSTICSIYDSADLVHWTLLDSVILDANGTSFNGTDCNPPGKGFSVLTNGAFSNVTGVPYRFYKVSNGPFWSQPIGFQRVTVPGTPTSPGTNFIADQLIAPANTLNGLLNPMIDGSTLPDGSQINKWNGAGYDTYTYSSGSWSPNGNATLLPGEGAYLVVTNATTITFAGLVQEGSLTNLIVGSPNFSLVSSQIPQAGGIQTVLGYNPQFGDSVLTWIGSGNFNTKIYAPGYNGTNDWYDGNTFDPTNEPIMSVGQSFFIENGQGSGNNEYWIRNFPGCCGQ